MQRHYRRGSKSSDWRRTLPRVPQTPSPPLGKLLKCWEVRDLEVEAEAFRQTAAITESQFVTSYNWLEGKAKEPTILVPGKPPRWTPLKDAPQLKEDSGEYFRDKNAARYPKHPMEPAILALLEADPTIRVKLDIVACGSTIGNLLRFVRNEGKSFRILVEMVDGVSFFIRRENSPTQLIADVRGYGHTFPEAYTSWEPDVKGSASHQRLIRYSFGGLQLVVRFEGDGYITESPSTSELPNAATMDDLIPAVMAGNISENVALGSKLTVQHGGEAVHQDSIFNLKTRSIKKKGDNTFDEELPRLWVAQLSKFILAYHTGGVFNDIEIRDVGKEVQQWEKSHNTELSQLAALMHRIISQVRTQKDGKLELCCDGLGGIEIREQRPEAGNALSAETQALWVKDADMDQNDIGWAEDDDYTACTESCGYCGHCTY